MRPTSVALLLGFSAFMVVGALIVAHRPGNPIGWIFSAIALLSFTGQLAGQYAIYAYVTRPGSLPGASLAAWYGSWPWWPGPCPDAGVHPLVVPHRSAAVAALAAGRLAGRGGHGGLTALASLQTDLRLETVADQVIANPIGVAAVGNPEQSPVGAALIILLVVLAAAAFGSLVLRFRRSRGEERQQLKWFTYAGALVPLVAAGRLPARRGRATCSLRFPSCSCRSPPASRSCATGCTTSTG